MLVCEKLLFAAGRVGNTEGLGLENVGLSADDRGAIKVDDKFRTSVPNIYAAGDVIGFPALASTSMEQARVAVCHAFDIAYKKNIARIWPYGIYTIPEISMVGQAEQQLTARGVRYEVGVARYEDLAKGQMIGDDAGFLKVLFDPESLRVLGVHIIGTGAAELIHIAQTLMATGGTLDVWRDAAFNHPTLAEAYKVGIAVETRDIADVKKGASDATQADVDRVFTMLLNGSEKHLSAFTDAANGVTHTETDMRGQASDSAATHRNGMGAGTGAGNRSGGGQGDRTCISG